MKIFIDASRAINEKAGVGKYTDNLIRNLQTVSPGDEFLLMFNFFSRFSTVTEKIQKFKSPNTVLKPVWFPGKIKERLLKSRIGYTKYFTKKSDVVFAPTFLDVDLSMRTPQVVTIHDLSYFRYPEHLGEEISRYFQEETAKSCQKSTKIIAVSESTKKDLIEILDIAPEKITVTYLGGMDRVSPSSSLPLTLTPKTYILAVGTLEPRKNLKNLLTAYSLLPAALRAKHPLVVAGAKGWNTAREIKDLKDTEGVKWLGYVSNSELTKLYQEAAVFAYPSLYEGFGLPVLEALNYGLPVLTSNTSSLPEVAGEAALLIDPFDKKAISSGLQRLLEDKELTINLSKKALIQAEKFSWEKCAQETLGVLKSV